MRDGNKNIFNGEVNFYGSTQFATGNIYNNVESDCEKATYKPEPVWRSPFTLAVLSWISFIIGVLGLFPFGTMIKCVVDGIVSADFTFFQKAEPYAIVSTLLICLVVFFILLRDIAKKQTRHPLRFNYAISGYGKRLTLEKIHTGKCPRCGGKMRYYNKPVEWVDKYFSDGKTEREVTKRSPVLECERNSEHCYWIDPAEDVV